MFVQQGSSISSICCHPSSIITEAGRLPTTIIEIQIYDDDDRSSLLRSAASVGKMTRRAIRLHDRSS